MISKITSISPLSAECNALTASSPVASNGLITNAVLHHELLFTYTVALKYLGEFKYFISIIVKNALYVSNRLVVCHVCVIERAKGIDLFW